MPMPMPIAGMTGGDHAHRGHDGGHDGGDHDRFHHAHAHAHAIIAVVPPTLAHFAPRFAARAQQRDALATVVIVLLATAEAVGAIAVLFVSVLTLATTPDAIVVLAPRSVFEMFILLNLLPLPEEMLLRLRKVCINRW